MSLPARFAIIGYGSAGRGIHSRLIREAGFLVTAIVTRDEGRKRAATEDWPAAAVYDEISELIAHPDDFDVIVIASPSGRHVAHAEQVIDAGLAFVIEKPLAPTALQASDIVDRAAKARVPFTVFQNRRWDAEQLTARRLIESGELGRVHTSSDAGSGGARRRSNGGKRTTRSRAACCLTLAATWWIRQPICLGGSNRSTRRFAA